MPQRIEWVSKLFGGISKLVSGLVWWEHQNYPNFLVEWFGGAGSLKNDFLQGDFS